jgi:ubiquinone/menaquinone biosynthesis C-methylase UbiE
MRVLDLCCGHGATLVPLGARGVDAVGLDLSPALLRMAQSKGLRKLVCGDSTVLPFRSGAFHVVTIQGGFHHLWADQFERALAEIVRVLKPGGYLAFTEPANTWVLRLYVRLVDGPLANLTAYTRNWRLTLEQERPTYFHWLKTQDRALASLAGRMELVQLKKGLVTLFGLARRRTEASAR